MTKILFSKNGVVSHGSTGQPLGFWRKEEDPVYAAGRFRVWKTDERPEDGLTCYPRYMGLKHFREEIEKIENAAPSDDFGI